ncbi:MAG TPA: lipid-A-disaccharide synthase [Vicinamibacterales bacterium]|nr:lipid-A-disaccharide synthase [Vicinamibacterales bacterium]
MRVMLSCGEASGDLYAGALVEALRARVPAIDVFGLGGDRFEKAGGRLVGDFHKIAVTGLLEAVRIIPESYAMYRRLIHAARTERPDVLVLIDFPDFNFRLMAAVKRLGVPVVYYVSPQLWAWRPGRIQTMKALVDLVLPIFPFEESLYRAEGVAVQFVGHPLVELAHVQESREGLTTRLNLDRSRPIVALLPGSRPNELQRIVPVLAAAVPRIASAVTGTQFLVARAPNLPDSYFRPFHGSGAPVRIVADATDDVLAASDAVITASGTATVQAALHRKPMVVVYRLSPVTYKLGKPLVRVSMYSMVNLVAGERVVVELIQEQCTPEAVARETVDLLTNHERVADMMEQLAMVREKLGGIGASGRAADAILEVARRQSGTGPPTPPKSRSSDSLHPRDHKRGIDG